MVRKILVIDDEPDILTMVGNRLRIHHYEVITALSCEEGLEKIKKEHPDLVFLDYIMPFMNGGEALRILKKDPATKDIPVIMFTADVKEVRVGEFQSLGAEDCLFKPFTPEELLNKVQKVFEKGI